MHSGSTDSPSITAELHPAFPPSLALSIADVDSAHRSLVRRVRRSTLFASAVIIASKKPSGRATIEEADDRSEMPSDGKARAIDLLCYEHSWGDLLECFRSAIAMRRGPSAKEWSGRITTEHERDVSRLVVEW